MIVNVNNYDVDDDDDDDDNITFTTNGCGCCSVNYDIRYDKDKIISELKENIKIVKESCLLLNIDFDEFVNEI